MENYFEMNNGEVWDHAAGTLEDALERSKSNVSVARSVEVNVPSTTANMGPGFDVFGLAHDAFLDSVKIEVVEGGSVDVEVFGVDSKSVSREVDKNTAGVVASSLVKKLPSGCGLRLRITKGIPVGKGLGSSGASAAACVFGLNKLLDLHLSNNQMIQLAADGEVASAGSAHADNVAASVLGGFTIIQSYEPFHVIRLSPPENLRVAVAVPEVSNGEKKTAYARALLPKLVSMEKMVRNVGHASSMIVGILTGDLDLIGRSMMDTVVEPERAKLIPGYWKVKKNALAAGAQGVTISGAGPTMIAIVDEKIAPAIQVAEAMKEGFEDEGIICRALASKPSKGANIVEER
jgi:homoserine kinase